MTDSDLETIYKSSLPVSHFAGLRAVYDAGYDAAASVNPAVSQGDASASQPAPAADVTITTP
jgi:hypothetical protein